MQELWSSIKTALDMRKDWLDEPHQSAFRLYNGFIEGFSDLAIDIYARTMILFNFAKPSDTIMDKITWVTSALCMELPWIQAVILKTRHTDDLSKRHGVLIRGDQPNTRIREHGVWYAVDLQMSSDASLYLDTRELRSWIIKHSEQQRVLNSFAYTGSLGVAAKAGGASQVIHLDRNRAYLNLGKTSYSLNGFHIQRADFISEDFFPWTSRMRRTDKRFDMVFLDPPFFSQTVAGRVDLNQSYDRLINKLRPLVEHGGRLIAVNNALFVSGKGFMQQLDKLSQDGYMEVEELIPVPADFAGYVEQNSNQYPADPAPFNHPTKIAVLKVR